MTGKEGKGEFERLKEEVERAKDASARGMANLVLDLFSTFDLKHADTLKSRAPDEQDKILQEKLSLVLNMIDSTVNSEIAAITIGPRVPRPGKDKEKFLPGQHKGVHITFLTATGEVAAINLYGGLRDTRELELKDTDKTLARIHSARTDAVLSQSVQLNFHIKSAGTLESLLDVWFTYRLGTGFSLNRFSIEGEKTEFFSRIGPEDVQFPELRRTLEQHAKVLMLLTPSAT